MKKILFNLALIIVSFSLIRCEDEEINKTADPGGPAEEQPDQPDLKFSFQINPSAAPASNDGLYAVMTITKENGTAVLTNHKIALHASDGKLVSEEIALPDGNHKLTKLIVLDGTNNGVLATPIHNTERSEGAQTLPLVFNKNSPLRIESITLNETDLPEEFGYAELDFGTRPYFRINLQSVVYISHGAYRPDATINISGSQWAKEVANGSETYLPVKYAPYTFAVEHWGIHREKTVTAEELRENSNILIESSDLWKQIKSESVSLKIPGMGTSILSRTDYTYHPNGKLDEILYYSKKLKDPELTLQTVARFEYQNSILARISRFSGESGSIGYTTFEYDHQLRLKKITELSYGEQTTAVISYGTNDFVSILYTFSNGKTMTYNMEYKDSNKVGYEAHGTGSETGKYSYDNNINPYFFLNYYDLYFSNTSKNNRIGEEVNYGGNIPSLELYKTEYIYDSKGYPDLVFKSYRGYMTKEHISEYVTEYTYY